jgi:RHS repeat-associated protein
VDAAKHTWTLRGPGAESLRIYTYRPGREWEWSKDHIHRNGKSFAAVSTNGVSHLHPDHLGTPRQITRSGGGQEALHSYYPFGQEATGVAQDDIVLKFTGHERDSNDNRPKGALDYMHARFCNPTLGRFLSIDPAPQLGRSRTLQISQTWNRFVYANNNPLKYLDPDGLKAKIYKTGNEIRIELPTRFAGKGATPERIAAFKAHVESTWSGSFGEYTVTTKVTEGGLSANRVKFKAEDGRSYVRGSRFATIYAKTTPEVQAATDAHEAGHLMKLDDRYDKETSEANPGWEGNIMATVPGGTVSVENIEDVLEKNRVREEDEEDQEEIERE